MDKEGAFKSVFLRDAVSATEKLNTHNRLYSLAYYARSRMKTKTSFLASNPTPSAIKFFEDFRRKRRVKHKLPVFDWLMIFLRFSLRFQLKKLFVALLRIQQPLRFLRSHLPGGHRLALLVLILLFFAVLLLR